MLFLFSFLFLVRAYSYFFNIKLIYNLIIFFLVCFYTNELTSFFNDNFQFQFFNLIFYNQNFLLLNNLNKIHPFLLYFSAASLAHISLRTRLPHTFNFTFVKSSVLAKSNLQTLFLFYLVSLAIFLGAWWAEQEQSWNGWWNWDSSETLSLGIFFYSIFIFHYNFNFNKTLSNRVTDFNFLFLNLILYVLVQLNFEQTSHNFGLKFFFFFNNFYYLIFLTIIGAREFIKKNNSSLFLSLFFFIAISPSARYYLFYRFKIYAHVCIFFILMKIFLVSFIFNFNTKSWIIHTINIFNNTQYFYIENFFLVIVLLFYFFRVTSFFSSFWSSPTAAHFLILNFLFSSFFNSNYEFVNSVFFSSVSSLSLPYNFIESILNYSVELNFFEKETAVRSKYFILFPHQINYLFNVFENNLILSKTYFSSFISFFFKNNKVEIFEVNGVHCIPLEMFLIFIAFHRFFFKPLWIN